VGILALNNITYDNANDFTLTITTNRTSIDGPYASVSFDLIESSIWAFEDQPMLAEFMWDFGDTGDDYNIGKGHCVNHVYRDPGTYTVTVTAYYRNIVKTASVEITVNAIDGTWTTYYISADGDDDTGDGSELNPLATPAYAFANYLGSKIRFLLRQGDQFDNAGTINLGESSQTYQGPVIISSYEDSGNPSSAKPILKNITDDSSTESVLYLANTVDYRIVNLEIRAGGTTQLETSTYQYPSGISGDITYLQESTLVLDCDFRNIGVTGLKMSGYYCVAQDCDFQFIGAYGVFASHNFNCAYIGITMSNMGIAEDLTASDKPEYTIRMQGLVAQATPGSYITRCYFTHMDLRADYTKANFQLRGEGSDYNNIWKNQFDREIGVHPQNHSIEELLFYNTFDSNIIVARTEYIGNIPTYDYNVDQYAVRINTKSSMFRNNIAYGYEYMFDCEDHNTLSSPIRVWLYNNTSIANQLNSYFINVYEESKDIILRNNIFYNLYSDSASYADRFIFMSSTDVNLVPEPDQINSDYNIFIGEAWGIGTVQYLVSITNGSTYGKGPYRLADWQSALSNDLHSIFGDALLNTTIDVDNVEGSLESGFASVGSGSPAIDAGTLDTKFDYFGNRRSDRTLGAIGG